MELIKVNGLKVKEKLTGIYRLLITKLHVDVQTHDTILYFNKLNK